MFPLTFLYSKICSKIDLPLLMFFVPTASDDKMFIRVFTDDVRKKRSE